MQRTLNSQAPARATEVAERDAKERAARAIAALAASPPRGLVARRRLVTWERRLLLRVEWWDEFEPAWPIGNHPWRFTETHTSGDTETAIPTGITRTGNLVPLEGPWAGEQPVRTTPERPLPRFARLGQSDRLPVHPSRRDWLPIAEALETLVPSHGPDQPRQ